jgi:FAD/FMN-containing dehydrogenase
MTNLHELASALRGRIIRCDDPDYDDARRVHNAMIDRRPAAIARCTSIADVAACVRFAARTGSLLAVRGGGHSLAGFGCCDGGLVIDLSLLNAVRVDAAVGRVKVGGGCRWGEVDRATHAFGLATPNGLISSTGVGGLTLGGGIGHLTRRYGLTIDNLLSVEMVLADGSVVNADEQTNCDLFWAIRGGGGNFGVATSFTFRLHAIHTVVAGPMFWPVESANEVLERFQEFLAGAPEEIGGFFTFQTVPTSSVFPESLHGQTVCGVMWICTGSAERFYGLVQPVRSWPEPLFEGIRSMPLPVLQSMFDSHRPPGHYWSLKTDVFDVLSSEAIRAHAEHGSRLPTAISTIHLYPINGRVHRKAASDTAFPFRKALWSEAIAGVDPDGRNIDAIVRWSKETWQAVHRYSAGGAYTNFMTDLEPERVAAAYGSNYARLQRIKSEYDPSNVFRVNHNLAAPTRK